MMQYHLLRRKILVLGIYGLRDGASFCEFFENFFRILTPLLHLVFCCKNLSIFFEKLKGVEIRFCCKKFHILYLGSLNGLPFNFQIYFTF